MTRRASHRIAVLCLVGLLLSAGWVFTYHTMPAQATPATPSDVPQLPATLAFIPNVGQSDPAIRFLAQALGGSLFFQDDGVLLSLAPATVRSRPDVGVPGSRSRPVVTRPTLAVRFSGTDGAPTVSGLDTQPGIVNFYRGNDPARWHSNVATYGTIVYRDLYQGIDLYYNGSSQHLKGTYTVAPGADPGRIRWRYDGASQVQLDPATGDALITITLRLPEGGEVQRSMSERAPIAWQMVGQQHVPVGIRYLLEPDGSLRFAVEGYDPNLPLVIDPTLDYSSYVGGDSFGDDGRAIAASSDGTAYITGWAGLDFDLPNPIRPINYSDVFVIRLSPSGGVVWTTYLGADSNDDQGTGIVVDSSGTIFVSGWTSSDLFPMVGTPLRNTYAGGSGDAFIARLNSSGILTASTYVGGTEGDQAESIALDSSGSVYIAGYSNSSTMTVAGWPTANAYRGTNNGGVDEWGGPQYDAFLVKLNGNLSSLQYGSFLGGTSYDAAGSIAVASPSVVYIGGFTRSSQSTFNLRNALPGQTTLRGYDDGFIAKFNPTASTGSTSLLNSSYYGGNGSDGVSSITTDSAGNVYLTGGTSSSSGLPIQAPNASTPILDTTLGGSDDAFVSRINANWTISFGTYLGGSGFDAGNSIALDSTGIVYIIGSTNSSDFPRTNTLQANNAGLQDMFVVGIHPQGGALLMGSYLGGSDDDFGYGMALSRKNMQSWAPTTAPVSATPTPQTVPGINHVIGTTRSTNFPTFNGFQGNKYDNDGFVAKYSPYPEAATSYYIGTTNSTDLYNLGCARGNRDRSRFGTQNSFVFLAFGQPWFQNGNQGTLLPGTTNFATVAQITTAAQEFGRGYWTCVRSGDTSSQLILAIGTSNFGGQVTAAHGTAWAQMAKNVQQWFQTNNYSGQVSAAAAIDIELGWNPPSTARRWVDAYNAVSGAPAFYNFGDAEGCPTTGDGSVNVQCGHSTNNHTEGSKPNCVTTSSLDCWKIEDVWYVSRGVTSARAFPQIYRNDGSMALPWYQITLYGHVSKGSQRVFFSGALTQYQACKDTKNYPDPCAVTDQIPESGYRQLWIELQKDSRTEQPRGLYLLFSSDIRWTRILEDY